MIRQSGHRVGTGLELIRRDFSHLILKRPSAFFKRVFSVALSFTIYESRSTRVCSCALLDVSLDGKRSLSCSNTSQCLKSLLDWEPADCQKDIERNLTMDFPVRRDHRRCRLRATIIARLGTKTRITEINITGFPNSDELLPRLESIVARHDECSHGSSLRKFSRVPAMRRTGDRVMTG